MPPSRWICVFCASAPGASPAYLEAAATLGRLIAERGYGLLYGGATVGAMGAVADAALAAGGSVVGVIPEVIREREIDHKGLTEQHVVGTMHQRKALLSTRAHAFIALPGGYGTMDEFIEIVTWAQLRIHAKPCVLVNLAVNGAGGFYDGLLAFLDHTVREGFIVPENRELVQAAPDPQAALDLVERVWSKSVRSERGRSERGRNPPHDPRLDAIVR
jgi:hypothetical protein